MDLPRSIAPQTNKFKRTKKKLTDRRKRVLDSCIDEIKSGTIKRSRNLEPVRGKPGFFSLRLDLSSRLVVAVCGEKTVLVAVGSHDVAYSD